MPVVISEFMYAYAFGPPVNGATITRENDRQHFPADRVVIIVTGMVDPKARMRVNLRAIDSA